MEKSEILQQDNRQSVRITTKLLFAFERAETEKYQAVRNDFEAGLSLYNREELADIQIYIGAQAALQRLSERDEDLALFLEHLDRKVNKLLQKDGEAQGVLDSLKPQRLNISGHGLAFWHAEALKSGQILEMHLLLPPQNYVNIFGEVVECVTDNSPDAIGQYRISVKFSLIMENDRERLIQYNFKQQGQYLMRRRLDQETDE